MDDKTMLDFIKTITEQGVQLKGVAESMSKLEERMAKLEALREQDIKQNEKIEQILTRLQQGNEHFDRIEKRLVVLEQADGKRAKDLIKQITGILVAAVMGAIIGNIGGIIHWLGGSK